MPWPCMPACGELHRRLIQQGAGRCPASMWRRVAITGVSKQPIGRSDQDGVTLQLTRDDTRLAVTEMVTASPRQARQRDRDMAWKLAFAHWRQMVRASNLPEASNPFRRPGCAAVFCEFHGPDVPAKVARGGRALPGGIETAGWQRQREVMRLSIARHAFRRALKSGWCSIWRVIWKARVRRRSRRVLSARLTPRNLFISARRDA